MGDEDVTSPLVPSHAGDEVPSADDEAEEEVLGHNSDAGSSSEHPVATNGRLHTDEAAGKQHSHHNGYSDAKAAPVDEALLASVNSAGLGGNLQFDDPSLVTERHPNGSFPVQPRRQSRSRTPQQPDVAQPIPDVASDDGDRAAVANPPLRPQPRRHGKAAGSRTRDDDESGTQSRDSPSEMPVIGVTEETPRQQQQHSVQDATPPSSIPPMSASAPVGRAPFNDRLIEPPSPFDSAATPAELHPRPSAVIVNSSDATPVTSSQRFRPDTVTPIQPARAGDDVGVSASRPVMRMNPDGPTSSFGVAPRFTPPHAAVPVDRLTHENLARNAAVETTPIHAGMTHGSTGLTFSPPTGLSGPAFADFDFDDDNLGDDAEDDTERRRAREQAVLDGAERVLNIAYRGTHCFSGQRVAGWVTKPPTVTSRLRRAVTGSKWVRQFLWVDGFKPDCFVRYGPADGNEHRSLDVSEITAVGSLTAAELKQEGCPTCTIDHGFFVRTSDGRTVYFATEGEDRRDGFVAAIRARMRHVEHAEDDVSALDADNTTVYQLTVLLAQEIDKRERIAAAEREVVKLVLLSEFRRLQRRLGRRLRKRASALSGVSTISAAATPLGAGMGDRDSTSDVSEMDSSRSRTSSVATASSFSSFAGQAQRGLYAKATWAASVKDTFAARGTWLYKTSRRRIKAGGEKKGLADIVAGMLTTWTKRFVRVRDDTLVYSVDENNDVKGTIPLPHVVDVGTLETSDLAKLKSPFKWGFVLRTREHENVWCAETQEVRDAWVCALERLLLEDADKEREAFEYQMRPLLGVMEVEARDRGDIEDSMRQTFADVRAQFREAQVQIEQVIAARDSETREAALEANRRSGSANLPRAAVPPHALDTYCRTLKSHASRHLAPVSLSSAVFDTDGLCLTTSGDHPQMYASLLASLLDCASRLHPDADTRRIVPEAMAVETTARVVNVEGVDYGLFAYTMARASTATTSLAAPGATGLSMFSNHSVSPSVLGSRSGRETPR